MGGRSRAPSGAVLDPIFSLRCRCGSRRARRRASRSGRWSHRRASEVLDLADKHHDPTAFERAVTLAWTQAQVQLHHLGIGPDEAHLFQRLANHVLYSDPALRPSSDRARSAIGRGPRRSGPTASPATCRSCCVRIDDSRRPRAASGSCCRAHEYWRMKRLSVDLVILNETARLVRAGAARRRSRRWCARASRAQQRRGSGGRGTVFVLRADLISVEVRTVLRERGARPSCWAGAGASPSSSSAAPRSAGARRCDARRGSPVARAGAAARRAASSGTASADSPTAGASTSTILGEGQWTPAPWINVVANPAFGFQTSVEGGGYTWSGNSRENQLTAWSNDPVGDRPGEVLYVRDEDDGVLLAPTALPIRDEAGHYVARHGHGYSRFEHASHGLALELLQYVPLGRPDQDRAAEDRESLAADATPLGHGLRRVGARPVARRRGAVRRRPRSIPRRARCSRAIRGGRASASVSPSSTWPDGRSRGPATAPSSSAATAPSRIRLRCRVTRRSRVASVRASIRAVRSRPRSRSRRTERPRSSSSWARPLAVRRRIALVAALPARGSRRRLPRRRCALGRRARHRAGAHARPLASTCC